MKYDFQSIIDRNGTNAIAVDCAYMMPGFKQNKTDETLDDITMWIADMNYATCPTVCEEIIERAKHPLFGYFIPDDRYFDAIIEWHEKRNGVTGLRKEHIAYENGVLGGVMSAVSAFTASGDHVLLQSPTYMGFVGTLENNGYQIVYTPLVLDENNVYRMDYEDMDRKLKEYSIHVAVFCAPHNPSGRVWEKWELEKALEIFKENDVIVVSDEIWSDILLNGNKHIPLQLVNEWARDHVIGVYAPSKTFNLGGLIGSYSIIYNKYLRDRVRAKASKSHYNDMNVLCMHALIGAYKPEGHEWTDQLCEAISENVNYAVEFIEQHFADVKVPKPEGTYMLFIDVAEWCRKHDKTLEEVLEAGWNCGVIWQDGRMHNGTTHIRMNLALPLSRVQEAFDRLDKYVFNGAW